MRVGRAVERLGRGAAGGGRDQRLCARVAGQHQIAGAQRLDRHRAAVGRDQGARQIADIQVDQLGCIMLALHGADDPFVPEKDLAAFESEMRDAKVDWQLVQYGGAVHSFTDWNADRSMKGAQYNERADKRSWEDLQQFLAESFK